MANLTEEHRCIDCGRDFYTRANMLVCGDCAQVRRTRAQAYLKAIRAAEIEVAPANYGKAKYNGARRLERTRG